MLRINTKFTRLLGIRSPVVSACMAGASGGALAAQTTAAGGFGFLAIGYETPDHFKNEIALARKILQVDHPKPLPIGVGALGWLLDKPDYPGVELLRIALNEGVRAIWLSFGVDVGKWVSFVREHDRKGGNKTRTTIFTVVSSVEQALVAINDWKVDVVVAEGIEAGGHGYASSPPLFTLLPLILSAVSKDAPPILGAGGLTTGAHVAAVLSLGASGAVVGTRFLATPESLYSDAQKKALVAASSALSVRSMAFDRARGTTGWPEGVDGRGLMNKVVELAESGASDQELRESLKLGDPASLLVWAGCGVGLVNAVKPAQEIVSELHEEAIECLKMSSGLISEE